MLSVVIPIVTAVLLGMLSREKNIISYEGSAGAKKIALNITLPAVSLSAYLSVDFAPPRLYATLWTFAAFCIMLVMGFGAKKLLKSDDKLLPFLCTSVEGGTIGFSLYPMLHADMAPFSLIVAGNVLFLFTVYKVLISGARDIKSVLREALHSPSLWALIIGILMNVTGLYKAMDSWGIRTMFDDTLSFVAKSTGFLILFTIGYDLDFRTIQWKKALTAFVCREIICGIMLCVTLLVNKYLLHGLIETDAALVLFILPAPYAVNLFADGPENRDVLASSLSVMTCFTLIMFFIITAVRI